jgi:hypothetical protein
MIDRKLEMLVKKYEKKLDEIESNIAAMKKSVDNLEPALCENCNALDNLFNQPNQRSHLRD